ncbi:MAG: cyclic pyranopterin monophosphate synthase MoaC [Chloroflexi bacterium]|nr:cyclic pyranopterin monophosphate synthase MoaC [Chloroflexota bacterium]HIB13059.1 cyclic pyranopterin monophosphate synthase MoaC [Dehalococcoidia bacterium]
MTTTNAITIYTDGSCLGNPGPGGWGALVFGESEEPQRLSGHEAQTTNNRMELMAAIQGLEAVPAGSKVVLHSDSSYLVNTMTKNWKRRVNHDLWERLDTLSGSHNVEWRWVRGHNGDRWNEAADRLAVAAMNIAAGRETGATSEPTKPADSLTHIDDEGRARMVDVGDKPVTDREATAKGHVTIQPETLRLIKEGLMKKGDVLTIAQLAGIMGAKRTSELIPLCHPLPLNQVSVDFELDESNSRIEITASARTSSKTGVEMEALTAVSVAALTVYDMCKAVDRGIRIENIRLVRKRGGQSGDITLEE